MSYSNQVLLLSAKNMKYNKTHDYVKACVTSLLYIELQVSVSRQRAEKDIREAGKKEERKRDMVEVWYIIIWKRVRLWVFSVAAKIDFGFFFFFCSHRQANSSEPIETVLQS